MPREAGRDFSFVKHHMFQLPTSHRQPLLAVLQSSPNAAQSCPPLGWSLGLGYNAQPVGIFFLINTSSGETVSCLSSSSYTCLPLHKRIHVPSRKKQHPLLVTKQSIWGPLGVPYFNFKTLLARFRNIHETLPLQMGKVAQTLPGSSTRL